MAEEASCDVRKASLRLSHYRVTLNGKTTIFPDHGSKEIGTGLVEAIKKQLGIK
ncbi:type II toxin-antitoxin system HicA family toxin [Burkholderia gladioli]|uniref:type II toxin-antitoxin system HicA family toxin n=1 Tax=Burkholderia gladioli TaxID=28095 RepID=UPI003F78CD29